MAVNLEVEHVSYMIEEFPETASIWQEQHPKGQPTQWKGKGKEVEIPSIVLHTPPSSSSDSVLSRTKSLGEEEEQDQEVDWRSCEPPTGLNNVDGVDSEIVIELVQQSIKKVKWRILEEEEQRQRRAVEELETLSRECEENAKTNKDEEADANSLTQSTNERAVVPDDTRTTTVPRYHSIEPASFAGVRLVIDEHGLLRPAAASPTKSRKGGLLGLLRRFNTTEKAESSAQGAVRNQQNTPVGNPKLATFATKRKSAANVIKKAVSNDSPRTSVHEEDVYVGIAPNSESYC